jgi:hypothetical protein
MPVEGRDGEVVIMTFLVNHGGYSAGEAAAFLPEHAQELIDAGVAARPLPPPGNTAPPFASQTNGTLLCTNGAWTGAPTSFAYAWTSDGGAGSPNNPYTIAPEDDGHTFQCSVIAYNAAGSNAAQSNPVLVVVEVAASAAAPRARRRE